MSSMRRELLFIGHVGPAALLPELPAAPLIAPLVPALPLAVWLSPLPLGALPLPPLPLPLALFVLPHAAITLPAMAVAMQADVERNKPTKLLFIWTHPGKRFVS
jgi:hypothetical protein